VRRASVAFLGLTACLRSTTFHCATSADCGAGTCESTGFCAFTDLGCDSGLRYGDFSAGYTHQCVGSVIDLDAGVDAGPDALYDAKVKLTDAADPGMVEVSAGGFMMGCNSAIDTMCNANESPYHLVMLSGFEIDITEVTQSAYAACVTANACTAPKNGPSCSYDPVGMANLPVACVDWTQATAYCAWDGKRLPTEAEWEKAARGGDGRIWPWGNTTPDCTHASYSGCGGVVAVATLTAGASPYVEQDAAGNIEEWVNDWYSATYYASSPMMDPTGPATGTMKVFRGGSYLGPISYIRTSNRRYNTTNTTSSGIGFRCAR
jgi:formylglycine-generating enzyme required for sulfatase activity